MKQIECDKVFMAEVIISTQKRRGTGQNTFSPIRVITEVFTKDGEMIAEHDPCKQEETFVAMDLVDFAIWVTKNQPTTRPDLNMVDSWVRSIKISTPTAN